MRKIVINGGKPLKGEVAISGAKNSVVALIPAAILSDDIVILDGVPAISDVDSLIEIMEVMGAKIKREGETLEIDPRGVKNRCTEGTTIYILCHFSFIIGIHKAIS